MIIGGVIKLLALLYNKTWRKLYICIIRTLEYWSVLYWRTRGRGVIAASLELFDQLLIEGRGRERRKTLDCMKLQIKTASN